MAENILSTLRAEQLVRVTMDNNCSGADSRFMSSNSSTSSNINNSNNNISGMDVNNIIGRTAHICYCENALAARTIIMTLAPYLQ